MVRDTFQWSFDHIKDIDLVDVGVFQKHKNQVKQHAELVREILG